MHPIRNNASRRACALALAMLLFLLGCASVSPQLHERFHQSEECDHHEHSDHPTPDSDEAPHLCGVTFLQAGVVLVEPVQLTPPASTPHLLLLSADPSGNSTACPRPHDARAPPIDRVS